MLSLETQQAQSGSLKTKVATAVAATAAIGIVAAVTLSSSESSAVRKSTGLFNIPEDIKGHFSGGQITGEWTVQGKFHKFELASGDWQINSKLTVEGPLMEGSETYTLVDNVLIMNPEYNDEAENPIQCGTRENLPTYAKWADVLDTGAVLEESKMSEDLKKAVSDNCPEGSTSVAVIVDERSYVICADSTANTRSMFAFNKDFSFSAVSREGMTVEIEHPTGWEKLNCTTFDPTLSRDEAALRSGLLEDSDRELNYRINEARYDEDHHELKKHPEVPEQKAPTSINDKWTFQQIEDDQTPHNVAGQDEPDGENSELHDATVIDGHEQAEQNLRIDQANYNNLIDQDNFYDMDSQGNFMNDATLTKAPGGFDYHDGAGLGGNEGGGGGGGGGNGQNNQRKCAFFHGVGGGGDAWTTPILQSRFDDYWGPNRLGKRCSNHNKYIETDSRTRGYNTYDYHNEICQSLSHGDFSDATKSVIFTHSMGGLTTRRAFADNVCSWSGHYYMSQAPMSGSKAANFASVACLALSTFQIGWLIKWIMFGAYCNPVGLLSHYGYHTIYNNNPWYPSGGANSSGRLCGSQWSGLGGGISVILGIIQLFSTLQRRFDFCIIPQISCGWRGCRTIGCLTGWYCPYNDGMVPWDACAKNHRTNSMNVKRMGVNHGDGTGRNGDRSGGASIDQWFVDRTMLNFSEGTGMCQSCLTQYGPWG